MWIGDFVRGHTVVRVLKKRWPNRPVDLLTTSSVRPSGRLHAGRPRRDRLGSAAQSACGRPAAGAGARNCAPAAMEPPWSCPAPGSRRSRRPWPVFRNGWGSSAKPGSDSSTRCAGARRPCPASSTRTPRWRCRRRAAAAGMAGAAASGSRRRNQPLAAGQRARNRPGGRAGTRIGRRLQALDLLSGSRAAPGRTRPRRLGGRRPRRESAGAGNRRRRRLRRP